MNYNLLDYGIHATCDRMKSLSNVCFSSGGVCTRGICALFLGWHLNKILVLISLSFPSSLYGVVVHVFIFISVFIFSLFSVCTVYGFFSAHAPFSFSFPKSARHASAHARAYTHITSNQFFVRTSFAHLNRCWLLFIRHCIWFMVVCIGFAFKC